MWKVLSDLHSQRRSIRGRFSRDDAWLSFPEVRLGAGNSLVMNNEQHVYALRFDCDEGEDALTGVAFYIYSFIKTRQLSALSELRADGLVFTMGLVLTQPIRPDPTGHIPHK